MATAKKKTVPATAAKKVAKPVTKTVVKATPKAVAAPAKALPAKPVAKSAAGKSVAAKSAASKAAKAPKAAKVEKPRKPKLVRDSFTIPKNEYTVLDDLKGRAARLMRPVKKSEVLRAGIMALASMSDVVFLDMLAKVPAIKTGRPSNA